MEFDGEINHSTTRPVPKSLCQDLLLRLNEQKSTGQMCDVQLFCGPALLCAHSCVLASFSPFLMRYFYKSLNENMLWSISMPCKIHISSITKCKGDSKNNCMICIGKVIDFIYSGKIKLDIDHIDHIINISINLEIENLLLICQKFQTDIKHKNICIHKTDMEEDNSFSKGFDKIHGIATLEKVPLDNSTTPSESLVKCKIENENYRAELYNNAPNMCDLVIENTNYLEKDQAIKETYNETEKPLESSSNTIGDQLGTSLDKNSQNNLNETEKEELLGGRLFGDEQPCKKCHLSFSDSYKLEQHEKIYHSRKYYCLTCNFSSYKIVYILKHLFESKHKEKNCSVCLHEASDWGELKKHLEEHRHRLPFRCHVCNERFKVRTDWNRHMAVHLDETQFICKLCEVTFKRASYLDTHMLTHHKKPKYQCDLCSYSTPFPSFLKRHKLKHSKKNITCSIENCSFQTGRKNDLKRHLRTHDNERPFKCSLCNVMFTQDKNLRRHLHLVHNPHVRVFNCPKCRYSNSRVDKVKEHCKNSHPGNRELLDKIKEQFIRSKSLKARLIPRYQRANKISERLIEVKECFRKKPSSKFDHTRSDLKTQVLTLANEMNSDGLIPSDSMLPSTDNGDQSSSSVNTKQTVFVQESTGEISIMSAQKGQPIPVASLTSTNLLTIGNFREGTGSVTLNEATGVLTFNNINSESTGAVFLNESTGEMSYINLNNENVDSLKIDEYSSEINAHPVQEQSTLLNEETGEISTVLNSEASNHDLNLYDEDMFDAFDLDAFNEDSFDGFDEFDGFLFDPFNPTSSEAENDNFLNEFTGELFVENNSSIPRLNNVGDHVAGLTSPERGNLEDAMWKPASPMSSPLDLNLSTQMFDQTLLNEFTGEFILNKF